MSRDYLTTAEVLGIHDILIKRYGGAEGVRDIEAVEAAVFRPQCGYYTDVVQEACALFESLLINHPFIDGNKRASFAACDVFLHINGFRIAATSDELYALMMCWIGMEPGMRFQAMEEALRPLVALTASGT